MVNKENIQKLVDALRSGEYRQTGGMLRRGDSFCCLGVACDISGLGQWKDYDGRAIGNTYYEYVYDIPGSGDDRSHMGTAVLPTEVRDWLGVNEVNPEVNYVVEDDDGYDAGHMEIAGVASLNDDGYSFDKIADFFERTYLND